MSLEIVFKTSKNLEGLIPEPVPAYKQFPEWFAKIPKSTSKCPFSTFNDDIYQLTYNIRNEIGGCIGIQDFLKLGYIIPNWTTLVFRENFDGNLYVNWFENITSMEYEPHTQKLFSTMKNPPIYGHFGRIRTPWVIQTSPGVSCLITHPIWHRNKNFTTCTGVFHTDKSPLALPWYFEWDYKIQSKMSLDESFDLENQVVDRNEPIILIIPFYRKNFQSKIEYVEDGIFNKFKYMQRLNTTKIKTEDIYRKFRRTMNNLFT